eukprot:997771-Prorocentrum_minimum.AAC.3
MRDQTSAANKLGPHSAVDSVRRARRLARAFPVGFASPDSAVEENKEYIKRIRRAARGLRRTREGRFR